MSNRQRLLLLAVLILLIFGCTRIHIAVNGGETNETEETAVDQALISVGSDSVSAGGEESERSSEPDTK